MRRSKRLESTGGRHEVIWMWSVGRISWRVPLLDRTVEWP